MREREIYEGKVRIGTKGKGGEGNGRKKGANKGKLINLSYGKIGL